MYLIALTLSLLQGNVQDPTKMPNQNQFGPTQQVAVDGTYQILAYEKYGQVIPGMAGIKVAIQNNILIFPGDAKNPGKRLHLYFGANNTILITPIDNRTDLTNPAGAGTIPPVGQNNGTIAGAGAAAGAAAGAGQGKDLLPPGKIPPRGNQNPNAPNPNLPNNQNFIPYSAESERGVYVMSLEYFSISVVAFVAPNERIPGIPANPVNPNTPVPPGENGPITSKNSAEGPGGKLAGNAASSAAAANQAANQAGSAANQGAAANQAGAAAGQTGNTNNQAGGQDNLLPPNSPVIDRGPYYKIAVLVLKRVGN